MTTRVALLATVSIVLTSSFALRLRAQEVLPRPEQPFKGHIGRTVKDSTKDFPQEVKAPKGAPNILLILTDDVGFGARQHVRRAGPHADHGSAGERRVCATRSSTPRRSARPRARRC